MNVKIDLNSVFKNLQEWIQVISATFRDKGFKPFFRAFIVGAAFVLAPYIAVYSPSAEKLSSVEVKIKDANDKANFAASYKSLRDSLNAMYARLPAGSQQEEWLGNTVLNALKAENITADSIQPPEDEKNGGLLAQKVRFSAPMKYSQLIALANRLEQVKPRLKISNIELKKLDDSIGVNEVSLEVSTIIPLERLFR